jgi:hypothetical protein
MKAVQLDLTGDLLIERGSYYRSLSILFLGDYVDWDVFGQIRNKPGGDLYADFQFEPIVLVDRTEGLETKTYSRIVPFLGAGQTLDIPATKAVATGQPIAVGRNRWAYDIKIRSPFDSEIVLTVCEGVVEVSDRVTVVV